MAINDNQQSQAESLADMFGVILGAAASCDFVTDARLDSLTVKVRELIAAAADTDDDMTAAGERFSLATQLGRDAVATGQIVPQQVEAALNDLEERLSL